MVLQLSSSKTYASPFQSQPRTKWGDDLLQATMPLDDQFYTQLEKTMENIRKSWRQLLQPAKPSACMLPSFPKKEMHPWERK